MNKTLGYVHFWVTAYAYGVFLMHFIGIGWFTKKILYKFSFPLFDELADT